MFEYARPKEEPFTKHPEIEAPLGPGFEGKVQGLRTRSGSNVLQDRVTLNMIKQLRHGFYEWMFPLPAYTRNVAWVLLILWSIAALITAVR